MECKLTLPSRFHIFKSELIDTLWNVNQTVIYEQVQYVLELIDTLWNVNVPDL